MNDIKEQEENEHNIPSNMLLKLTVLSTVLAVVSARNQLTNCLDDNKYCVGLPRGCLGPECFVAFSSISNGTHAEVEVFGTDVIDKTWLAIGYSQDREMEDDIVLYCTRDDKNPRDKTEMAGLAYNVKHNSERVGTIADIREQPKKDKFGLDLNIVEYELEEKTLYCKFTHKVQPIIKHFTQNKVEILMAKGVLIKRQLSYHGKTRNSVGIVDLSGEPKKKKAKSSSAITLFSTAATFLAAKILLL